MADTRAYTAQLQAGLGMIHESLDLLRLWEPNDTTARLSEKAVASGVFSRTTARRSRNIVREMFAPRFLSNGAKAASYLKQLAGSNHNSEDLTQLFFLYTARAQAVFAEFVTDVYWPKYSAGSHSLTRQDAESFVQRALDVGKTQKRWTEATVQRMSGYLLGCCADFGLIAEVHGGNDTDTSATTAYFDTADFAIDSTNTLWAQTFSYDPFGNISKSGSMSWLPVYSTANNNQYKTGWNSVSYDASGNLLNDTFHQYTWDVYGKLSTIDSSACGSNGSCLTYDAFGNMVEKNTGGIYKQVLYSPVGKIAIMSGQTAKSSYMPLPGGATDYDTGTAHVFWHKDWQGSARLATSVANRTVSFDLAFAPFGEAYDAAIGGTTNQDFTGDTQDTISGLFDTSNRELHPNQGRWLSPDPAGLSAVDVTNPQSWNRYTYVTNKPLTNIDSTGLHPVFPVPGYSCDEFDNWICSSSGNFMSFNNQAIIWGNDIFDAIQGTPGTFLYTDLRGNLGFGFSSTLWASTLDLIDSIRNSGDRPMVGFYSPTPMLDKNGNPILISPDQRPELGDYPYNVFQTTLRDWGTYTEQSGLLADLANGSATVNDLGSRVTSLGDKIQLQYALNNGVADQSLINQFNALSNQLNTAVNQLTNLKTQIWLMTLGWPVNQSTISQIDGP